MILVNEIAGNEAAFDDGRFQPQVIIDIFEALIRMMAPFAPFVTAELWEQWNGSGPLLRQSFPIADPELVKEDEIEVPVQANGKLITVIKLAAAADEEAMKAAALADVRVAARLEGKTLVKVVVIKGKLVNLVLR